MDSVGLLDNVHEVARESAGGNMRRAGKEGEVGTFHQSALCTRVKFSNKDTSSSSLSFPLVDVRASNAQQCFHSWSLKMVTDFPMYPTGQDSTVPKGMVDRLFSM